MTAWTVAAAGAAAILLVHLSSVPPQVTLAFSPSTSTTTQRHVSIGRCGGACSSNDSAAFRSSVGLRPRSSSFSAALFASPADDDNNSVNEGTSTSSDGSSPSDKLREKARQARLEAERLEATLNLERIDALEREVRSGISDERRRDDVLKQIEDLARRIDPTGTTVRASFLGTDGTASRSASSTTTTTTTTFSDPTGRSTTALSDDDVESAAAYLATLPEPVRDALAKAAGYELGYASVSSVETLVRTLYEKRNDLTAEELRRRYAESFVKRLSEAEGRSATATTTMTDSDIRTAVDAAIQEAAGKKSDSELRDIEDLRKLLRGELMDDEDAEKRAVLFPRVLQKEGKEPTEADAEAFFRILDRTTFMAMERPVKVKGGYMIKGRNARKSASELVEALDAKLAEAAPTWKDEFQFAYVTNVSPNMESNSNFDDFASEEPDITEQSILISTNDFSPGVSGIATTLLSGVSLFLAFLFCINTFGGNPQVVERLEEISKAGTFEIEWLDELLYPMLFSFGLAQVSHELGHLAIAWRDKIKITPPTILPSLPLPYLSFQNRIKTSPKDYNSLFDLAFAGPVAGLATSFLLLLLGLQLTTTVDAASAPYLPTLPVSFLTQSSLGGTLVDLFLGGGGGILLSQDPNTQIPLHPVAIAGFVSLMINALDLIPFGSNDGGRLSQAIFGRVGHTVFAGICFLIALVTSVLYDEKDIFLGFILINSFTQNDLEVPCRNEIDTVELPRAIAALVAWFIAVLILAPL